MLSTLAFVLLGASAELTAYGKLHGLKDLLDAVEQSKAGLIQNAQNPEPLESGLKDLLDAVHVTKSQLIQKVGQALEDSDPEEPEEPLEPLVPELPEGPEEPEAGACTDDDIALMRAAGAGDNKNNFPGMIANCGATSWSIFKGFEEDVFDKCLTGTINISTQCANCFAGAGKYGYDHCKIQCLASWCSQTCLDCSKPYTDTLNTCVGTGDLPQPTPC